LDWRIYEISSLVFLIIYALFVLFVLSFSELLNADDELDLVDGIFLSVFVVELACQTFVHMIKYYKDVLNSLDAAIIMVSFILFAMGVSARGLAVLRLLRLLRLIMVLRKASSNKRKRKEEFRTVYDESLDILRKVVQVKKLSKAQRKDLSWVI
jgi:hypothetical protein